MFVKTVAAARETTECPRVYSGNGSVCKMGFQSSFIYLLISVFGLIKLLRYFSSQQLIKASAIAKDVYFFLFHVCILIL